MPGHRRATPSIKFAGTHLYTWVERGNVRVRPAQEHNAMRLQACGHPPPIDATTIVLNAQTLVSKFVT